MKSIRKKLQWPEGFKLYDRLFFTTAFVLAFFFKQQRKLHLETQTAFIRMWQE